MSSGPLQTLAMVAGVTLGLLLLGTMAHGAPGAGPDLGLVCRVKCATLSVEDAAAVEARATTDLMARGLAQGTLWLRCESDAIEAEWEPNATVDRAQDRTVVRRAITGRIRNSEELLALVAELLVAASPPVPPAAPGELPGDVGAEAAGVGREAAAVEGNGAPPKAGTSEANGVGQGSSAEGRGRVVPGPRKEPGVVVVPPRLAPLPPPSEARGVALDLGLRVGAAVEVRPDDTGGAAGLSGAIALLSGPQWLGFAGELGVGFGEPGAFSLRDESAAVEVGTGWNRSILAAASFGAERLHIDPGEVLSPRERRVIRGFTQLWAGPAITVGPGELTLAVGGRAYFKPLDVNVDGDTRFSLGSLVPRLSVAWQWATAAAARR